MNKIKILFFTLVNFLFLNFIYSNCSPPHSKEYLSEMQSVDTETPEVSVVPEEPIDPAKPSSECAANTDEDK